MKTSADPYLEIRNPNWSCNFQHGHCTFVTIIFRLFAKLFINLAMRMRALFTKPASIFGLVGDILPLGLFPLGLRVLDAFLLILLHERTRRKIRLYQFSALIHIVSETARVSF